MTRFIALTVSIALLLSCGAVLSDDDERAARKAKRDRVRHIHRSRPRRLDLPLRADNISDEEVRELQKITAEIYPGAIANIGGVTEGCPCEEGPLCSSQVWIVAYKEGRYDGLMLSNVGDTWMVGLVQRWWFKYDSLQSRIWEARSARASDYRDVVKRLRDKQYQLQESFPECAPVLDGDRF